MPLFMDFHIISDVTIEKVKEAHMADEAIQEEYHVKYHQFWVNKEAGTVYCLVEGPDAETCQKVHQIAHGNIPCNIVEVEAGFFGVLMGKTHKLDDELVRRENGSVDLGYRFILVVDIIRHTKVLNSAGYKDLRIPHSSRKTVRSIIHTFNGQQIKYAGDDTIVAVFMDSNDAIECALNIRSDLSKTSSDSKNEITFKIGISGGQPLTKKDGFFEAAIRLAQRLCLIAKNREILISTLVEKFCDFEKNSDAFKAVRVIDATQKKFLENLFHIIENNLSDNDFGVENLSRHIGISQTQLYRKVTKLTGHSPNNFIRELKLQKARSLIKEKEYNISEVALEVGYQNPSYFSKCFYDRYGVSPSKFLT